MIGAVAISRPWHHDKWTGRRKVLEVGPKPDHLLELLERKARRTTEAVWRQVTRKDLVRSRPKRHASTQVAVSTAMAAQAVARTVDVVTAQTYETPILSLQFEVYGRDVEPNLDLALPRVSLSLQHRHIGRDAQAHCGQQHRNRCLPPHGILLFVSRTQLWKSAIGTPVRSAVNNYREVSLSG